MSRSSHHPYQASLSLRAQLVKVENLRCLYILDPEEHRAPLASSLYNLGVEFYHLKRWGEARNAYAESADLRRLLYTADPVTYCASFACSLHDLSYCLDELGLREDARVTGAESVDLRRVLYTADPEAYRAILASSLYNLGFCFSTLDLREDARAAVAESVDLRRVLYAADPEVYRAHLASSLYNLGVYLDDLKLWEDARAADAESTELRRLLYTADPEAYRADLADSLYNLGVYLSSLELWEDARVAVAESVDLRRVLYMADPDAYRTDLATSLHNLGVYSDKLKLWEDARVAGTESVCLRRLLYTVDPEAYRADLVETLTHLGAFHRKLGDFAIADSAEREAVFLLDLTNYKIQPHQFLGAGGFGHVYQAKSEKPVNMLWDRDKNDRKLVIKVLQSTGRDHTDTLTFSTDPNIQRQINREMTIWYKLLYTRHRNIVGFFGYITNIPDGFGLVSEYFSGGSIIKYLQGSPSADRALLCLDVTQGLRHLHAFDPPIVHGDVKPLNVVVHADGRAALCDFGLSYINTCAARVESSKRVNVAAGTTNAQTSVRYTTAGYAGTLRYLSPEQLSSDLDIVKPTFAADVYALACTLAEILIGKKPFASLQAESQIIDAILSTKQPYELTEITEHFPNFAFLDKCWTADPTARPTMDIVYDWMGVSE